jgi:hypothetical protein
VTQEGDVNGSLEYLTLHNKVFYDTYVSRSRPVVTESKEVAMGRSCRSNREIRNQCSFVDGNLLESDHVEELEMGITQG